MKGAKLYVAILTPLALLLGLIMAVLNWNESWSQNHLSPFDPFLYLTLFCIAITFMIASYNHPEKARKVNKLFGREVRLEHLMRLVCMFFGGVIVFGVNSPIWIVETLHLVFTFLGIAAGYYMIVTYAKSNTGRTWSLIGLAFGVIGFLGGFLMKWYSIAFGEVFATIPFVIWMYKTWILNKQS